MACGVVTAIAAAPFGQVAQIAALLLISLGACISVFVGVHRGKPNVRRPWYVFGSSIGVLFFSFVLRAAGVGQGQTEPILPDYVAVVGYLLLIFGVHLLRRLRVNDQDPTNLIDSVVLTLAAGVVLCAVFMIPYVKDSTAALGDRDTGIAFAVLDLLLFFAVTRLAIGPGARNTSYYFLFFAAVSVLLSDVVIDATNARMAIPGEVMFAILFPSLGFALCSAGALHPSMPEITRPATVAVARVTGGRLFLMALAVFLPPILVVFRTYQSGQWEYVGLLGPACVMIALLVMRRFAGIAQARERVADAEHVLARSTSSLVLASDKEAICSMSVAAASELVGVQCDSVGSVLVLIENHAPVLVAVDGLAPDVDLDKIMRLGYLLEDASYLPLGISARDVSSNNSDLSVAVAPLVSQQGLRGMLVSFTGAAANSGVLGALGSLATTVSLALEAIGLSEDLHRQRSNRRFRALIDNSAELIVVIGQEDKITFMSPIAERLLGGRQGDIRAFLATVHPEDRLSVLTLLESTVGRAHSRSVECRLVDVEDQVYWFEATATDMRDNPEVEGIVLNAHDITDRKAVEEDLRHRVLHDELTGIANRALFRDRLDHALTGRRAGESSSAVLFVDVDDFKTVNDGLGHGAGDELLKVIAFRLKSFLRAEDTAARLGGDEFAILLQDVESEVAAMEIASRINAVIEEPLDFHGRDVSVSASIGVVFASGDEDSEVLLRNADVAMYHAKASGKGQCQLFNEEMYQGAIQRLELKGDLVHAVERDELMLYYQPLMDMKTGRAMGFEALLRWNHPVRGFVPPDKFIPIAEETGFIIPIGEWVLRTSVQQLAEWARTIPSARMYMSINVSPHQLTDDTFVDLVASVLRDTQVDPALVVLELTETAVLEDPVICQRITSLRELGVGLAADDFGSGFASYAALQQLPFTCVKIDRSLIINFPDPSGKADAQVRSIIEMAHAIGLSVVAEGIEEPKQSDALAAMGCDRGQGFLFSRPLPAPDAVAWLYESELQMASTK